MILFILLLNFAFIESAFPGGFGKPVSTKKPSSSLMADRMTFIDSKANSKVSPSFSVRKLKASHPLRSNSNVVDLRPELKLFQNQVIACVTDARELIVNLMAFKEEKISGIIESPRSNVFQSLPRTFRSSQHVQNRCHREDFASNVDEIIQREEKHVQHSIESRFVEFFEETKNNLSNKELAKFSNQVSKMLQDFFDDVFRKISSLDKHQKQSNLNEVEEIRSNLNNRLGYNAEFMSQSDLEQIDLKINQELAKSTHILMNEESNAMRELTNLIDRHKANAKQLVESFVKRMSAVIPDEPEQAATSSLATNETVKTLKRLDKKKTSSKALDESKNKPFEENPLEGNEESAVEASLAQPKLVKVDQFYTEINGEPAQVKQFSLLGAPKDRKQGTSKNLSSTMPRRASNHEEPPFFFNDGYVCIKMKYHDYKAYEEYLKTLF